MKNQWMISILMLLALGLTGCKDEDMNQFHSETLDLLIEREDWEFDNETMQYYCHFDIPDITADIYDNGNWTICREFEKGTKNAFQVALPMSMFMTDTLSDNSVVYYTQHIDYRLSVGYVEIQLTNSDYLYPTDEKGKLVPPYEMSFRLQLIY